MNQVMEVEFGSHLYGTSTPSSDRDIKGIYLPTSREILLGQIKRNISSGPKKKEGEKNVPGDVDKEYFSLGEYCKLLAQGQTGALDMLFAPNPTTWIENDWIWNTIYENRRKFLSKNVLSFIGYAQTQAAKYGIKGSRIAAVRKVLFFLEGKDPHSRLDSLQIFPTDEFINFITIIGPQEKPIQHWEIVGRKFQMTATVKYVTAVLEKILEEYGQRALQAEKNEGIDWKALSHAVRVNFEGQELLSTGKITFPCPERHLLLDIKQGKMNYHDVATLIEEGLVQLKQIQNTSSLPEEPDYKWIDNFIYAVYGGTVNQDKELRLTPLAPDGCKVFFNQGHVKQYDASQSGPDKSVFTCPCGATEVIFEDAGTGA